MSPRDIKKFLNLLCEALPTHNITNKDYWRYLELYEGKEWGDNTYLSILQDVLGPPHRPAQSEAAQGNGLSNGDRSALEASPPGEQRRNDGSPMTHEDKEQPKLLLKNVGSLGRVRSVLGRVGVLTDLQHEFPEEFQALVSIYEGHENLVGGQAIKNLKEAGFLDEKSGKIEKNTQMLLKAALRHTSDGLVLVNPFVVQGREDLQTIEWAERENARRDAERRANNDDQARNNVPELGR